MYDSELVIRTAALAALKRLCEDARSWCGLLPLAVSMEMDEEEGEEEIGIHRKISIHLCNTPSHCTLSMHLLPMFTFSTSPFNPTL